MIRAYVKADEQATALVWLRSGLDEYQYLPRFQALTATLAQQIFREVIAATCRIWVDEEARQIRGFIALQDAYIDRLYVDPAHQNQGVGLSLLNLAKELQPTGLSLHTHQANVRARAFYEHADFIIHQFGISPEPECMPDVEYRWLGTKC